jgi:hypothetical protein
MYVCMYEEAGAEGCNLCCMRPDHQLVKHQASCQARCQRCKGARVSIGSNRKSEAERASIAIRRTSQMWQRVLASGRAAMVHEHLPHTFVLVIAPIEAFNV